MIQTIVAPNTEKSKYQSVFLAGTIDDGKSEDWQTKVIDTLSSTKNINVTVFNPRRDNWGELGDRALEKQIKWELTHLDNADYILMYIIGTSKSPISLLELGIHIHQADKVIVVCEPEFYRYENITVTCGYYNVPLYNTLGEGLDVLMTKFTE